LWRKFCFEQEIEGYYDPDPTTTTTPAPTPAPCCPEINEKISRKLKDVQRMVEWLIVFICRKIKEELKLKRL